jgi:hypothetical protein
MLLTSRRCHSTLVLCQFRGRCNLSKLDDYVLQLCAALKTRIRSVFACMASSYKLALDLLHCLPTCLKVSPHTETVPRATTC